MFFQEFDEDLISFMSGQNESPLLPRIYAIMPLRTYLNDTRNNFHILSADDKIATLLSYKQNICETIIEKMYY